MHPRGREHVLQVEVYNMYASEHIRTRALTSMAWLAAVAFGKTVENGRAFIKDVLDRLDEYASANTWDALYTLLQQYEGVAGLLRLEPGALSTATAATMRVIHKAVPALKELRQHRLPSVDLIQACLLVALAVSLPKCAASTAQLLAVEVSTVFIRFSSVYVCLYEHVLVLVQVSGLLLTAFADAQRMYAPPKTNAGYASAPPYASCKWLPSPKNDARYVAIRDSTVQVLFSEFGDCAAGFSSLMGKLGGVPKFWTH